VAFPILSGLLRAGLVLLVPLVPAALPAPAEGGADPAPARVLAIVTGLEGWLDRVSPYPARMELPEIVFVDPGDAAAMRERSGRLGGRLRGLYSAPRATIYLVRPWDPRDPRDVSVLLHELVHHRQVTARHWYCDAAQEWDAYRLQERWLAELGLDAGFYWPAVLLEASCTPRDIHPD